MPTTVSTWKHLQMKFCECDKCTKETIWQECCEIDGKWVSYLCYGESHTCMLEIAHEIYQSDGQDGVLKWATDLPLEWALCEPCEYESPMYKSACLVCWSPIERKAT
jgi:hypothetical protein